MDYGRYERKKEEWIILILTWVGISVLFGTLFYKDIRGVLFLLPFIVVFERIDRKKKMDGRKEKLAEQFTEALQIMIGNLKSGSSIEKATIQTKEKLKEFYGEEEFIILELMNIERGLKMNVTIETLFLDFGKRSDIGDIKEFSEVLSVAKRAGANLVTVMENTVRFILDKSETEREIRVLISGKKMEGRIMGYVLPAILFYINLAMPGISRSLYHNFVGVVIMTGILMGYLVCLVWFDRMSNIKV